MGHWVMPGDICVGSAVKTEGSWHHVDGGRAAPTLPTVPRMPTSPHRGDPAMSAVLDVEDSEWVHNSH